MLIVWKIWGFKIFQNLSISVCTCSTFTFLLTFLFRNFPPNSNTFRRTCIWIWQQNYNTRLFQNSFWPLYYSNSDILFWKHQKRSYWTKKISPLIFFAAFLINFYFFWWNSDKCQRFVTFSMCYESVWMVYEAKINFQKVEFFQKLWNFEYFWFFICIPFSNLNNSLW